MKNMKTRERLVKGEVLCNASSLVQELMSRKIPWKNLEELVTRKDENGNVPEVFEFWIVTPWLGEKLKDHGEVVTEFCDLVFWGRQMMGQLIYVDDVIGAIASKLHNRKYY
jgi:hypothetical protein